MHLRARATKGIFSPTLETREKMLEEMDLIKESLKEGSLKEDTLVVNVLTARYRSVDYLYEPAYNASNEEIFLFTINNNPSERIIEHLTNLKSENKRYILSFFMGEALGEDPYPFPEGEVLRRSLGTILDSRSFIAAKLENIYFLIVEWIAGINSAVHMSNPTQFQRQQISAVINLLESFLNYQGHGLEINRFMNRAFGTTTPLVVP